MISGAPGVRRRRMVDGVASSATVAAAGYMVARVPVRGLFEWFPSGRAALPMFATWALIVCGGLWLLRRRDAMGLLKIARVSLLLFGALLAAMAVTRFNLKRRDLRNADFQHWPPRLEEQNADRLERLTSRERAAWGTRVAMHRFLTQVDSVVWGSERPLTIPRTWPLPPGLTVATRKAETGAFEVWARAADGTTECMSWLSASPRGACDAAAVAPDVASFRPMMPVDEPLPSLLPDAPQAALAWPQYRRNAQHAARVAQPSMHDVSWTTELGGDARSTASIVEDAVVIATHGGGDVIVLEAATGRRRWVSRVPNWVHMDVVSDGRLAIVGFGDNMMSFVGRAPSGIAAYDVRSGRHQWTQFDESSDMTSPVLRDSAMLYATAGGVLRKRLLRTGKILAQDTLPGGSVMAPPAMHGDTVVFTLEPDHVCAVLFSSMKTLWCRRFAGWRMLGHAAPAVHNGRAIVSGAASIGAITFMEFVDLRWMDALRLIAIALFPTAYEVHAGQRFMALSLRDGSLQWKSALYSDVRPVEGHIAGSAAIADSTAVIVLPISNVVVGFNPMNGVVRWQAAANGGRGPPLLLDEHVVVSGKNGVTEVRSALDGTLSCRLRRGVGYDRAGPVTVGGVIIFSNVRGTLEAMPTKSLLTCAG